MKEWIEVRALFSSDPEDWSPAIEAFGRHGCASTLQEDSPPALIGYLGVVPGLQDRLSELSSDLAGCGAHSIETAVVAEENWAENWKQFFRLRRIGKVVVRPEWEAYEAAPGEVVVTLNPGQAFGTGDHPTTRVCLALLQEVELAGKKVADVGCGSGILAIAATLLGAGKVVASDIDAQSVEIARENAAAHRVAIEFSCAADLAALGGNFDVVVSNIITATLIRIAPEVCDAVAAGGYWIVSGIIAANWRDMRRSAEEQGFEVIKTTEEDEWVGAIFRR